MKKDDFSKIISSSNIPSNNWDKKRFLRYYLIWLGKKLNFKSLNQFHGINNALILEHKGRMLLPKYKHHCYFILKKAFPEYEWLPWKFERKPLGFWHKFKNHQWFMKWLAKRKGYNSSKDLYKITSRMIKKNGGGTLLSSHYDSVFSLVEATFPEHTFYPWLFGRIKRGFWKSKINRRKYLIWFGMQMNYQTQDDWYSIKQEDINKYGGSRLLSKYTYLSQMVTELLDEYQWKPWLFDRIPQGYWDLKHNRRKYLDWLFKKLGYRKWTDWYKTGQKDFLGTGSTLYQTYYKSSHIDCIIDNFPEFTWHPWKFKTAPSGYWTSKKNIRKYLSWLEIKLNINNDEDWYGKQTSDLKNNYGYGLINHFSKEMTMFSCAKTIRPNYDYKPWLFKKASNKIWKDKRNIKDFVKWFGKKLGYEKKEDWYNITNHELISHKGSGLYHLCDGSAFEFLKLAFPRHKWNYEQYFTNSLYRRQRILFDMLKSIFPKYEILWEKEFDWLVSPKTGSAYRLDIYIVELNLCIEYMGEQHYRKSFYGRDDFDLIEYNDKVKRHICNQNGIKVIDVKYTWMETKNEILEILKENNIIK